jgi:crotonobetainyl-CoA:carnitine CoA-transferase CaiB-like acyl-CoA transferase
MFSQRLSPGALEQRGFSPRHWPQQRPGIVYLTISAFSVQDLGATPRLRHAGRRRQR